EVRGIGPRSPGCLLVRHSSEPGRAFRPANKHKRKEAKKMNKSNRVIGLDVHRMVRRCGHWSERCRNSVRYREASASALALSVVWVASSSFGGGAVRLATGEPTAMKNSSCPAGEHMQRSRADRSEELRNW